MISLRDLSFIRKYICVYIQQPLFSHTINLISIPLDFYTHKRREGGFPSYPLQILAAAAVGLKKKKKKSRCSCRKVSSIGRIEEEEERWGALFSDPTVTYSHIKKGTPGFLYKNIEGRGRVLKRFSAAASAHMWEKHISEGGLAMMYSHEHYLTQQHRERFLYCF